MFSTVFSSWKVLNLTSINSKTYCSHSYTIYLSLASANLALGALRVELGRVCLRRHIGQRRSVFSSETFGPVLVGELSLFPAAMPGWPHSWHLQIKVHTVFHQRYTDTPNSPCLRDLRATSTTLTYRKGKLDTHVFEDFKGFSAVSCPKLNRSWRSNFSR